MTARQWVFAVTLDALLGVLLYAWLMLGMESAGTFFIGAMWATGVIGVIALFGHKPKQHTLTATIYHAITQSALILALVYAGHVWLAGLHMTVWLFMEARRTMAANPAEATK